jgi:hypothetical protein
VQTFDADTDYAALRIAHSLQDACAEQYRHLELWQDERLIARSADARGARRRADLPAVAQRTQENLLALEEVLLSSHQAIADSRRLLGATQRLRNMMASRRSEGMIPGASAPPHRSQNS